MPPEEKDAPILKITPEDRSDPSIYHRIDKDEPRHDPYDEDGGEFEDADDFDDAADDDSDED